MVGASVDIIWKYFVPQEQIRQKVEMLGPLYEELNKQVNVVSRKDIQFLYLHHVLHSLAFVKYGKFQPGDTILDLGTGGGFPGIPLAIMYPDCHFTLIDGTQKKINVVNTIIRELGLTNAVASPIRAEDLTGSFDYVVSRAVASTHKIFLWSKHLVSPPARVNDARIFLLKGGDLTEELKTFPNGYILTPIQPYFREPYFREKYILAF